MDIGFIGLGKMGMNMITRLSQGGHRVVAYDLSPTLIAEAEEKGAAASSSLEDLIAQLPKPRSVWVMVPSGKPTEDTVQHLRTILETTTSSSMGAIPNFMMMSAGPPTCRNVAFIMSTPEPAAVFGDYNSVIVSWLAGRRNP
jgi:3-hydroxyisobutyrate dehydrogenase-like beta-hydroxyacid dehydrogenase